MEAAGDVRGYLLDLRNNPGGQVREAMEQASLFLPNRQAVVAYTLDSAGFLTTHDVKKIQANEIADLEAGGGGGTAAAAGGGERGGADVGGGSGRVDRRR